MSTLWKDKYLVGNIIIDAEHRQLITLVDLYREELAIPSIKREGIYKILRNLLKDHVLTHFGHEQLLMDLAEYYEYTGTKLSTWLNMKE